MMYFLTVYSTQGKNSLQKALVHDADEWNGTLIKDEFSKKQVIDIFRRMLDAGNMLFPKCRPCIFSFSEEHIAFQSPEYDSFVQITLKKVNFVYNGFTRMKAEEGGAQ